MSAIPTKAREVVRERQNEQCARCGCPFTEIHHRMRRREGGHGYANLVGLCWTCHKWVHANPVLAAERGYIIGIHITDIASVHILSFMGWMTFDDAGEASFVLDN